MLLAEDGKVNQLVAFQVLKKLGYTADIVCNGLEAVEAWVKNKYDIILMDCHMPEMDGFEAAVEIRRRENELGLIAMPIVALTASVLQEDRDRCISSGMNDIIGKPVQPAELAQALRRFVPKDTAAA